MPTGIKLVAERENLSIFRDFKYTDYMQSVSSNSTRGGTQQWQARNGCFSGFTLIEMMVVLLVIAILAAMAIPTYLPLTARKQVNHALEIPETYKLSVKTYYNMKKRFPSSNEMVGMPDPDKLISNTVRSMTLENGALHVELGNRVIRELDGKILSIQPLVVTGSPASPIDWACGYAAAPPGMEKAGENKTNVEKKYLPSACR